MPSSTRRAPVVPTALAGLSYRLRLITRALAWQVRYEILGGSFHTGRNKISNFLPASQDFLVGDSAKGRRGIATMNPEGGCSQTVDDAGVMSASTLESALYWRQIYSEMLEMEERVLARIDLLMDTQSELVKR